jgi:hypothetical protein
MIFSGSRRISLRKKVGKLIKKNGACKREEVLMLLDGKLLRIVTPNMDAWERVVSTQLRSQSV